MTKMRLKVKHDEALNKVREVQEDRPSGVEGGQDGSILRNYI
jgi:hypothetical protein